jgi:copper resistance protein B
MSAATRRFTAAHLTSLATAVLLFVASTVVAQSPSAYVAPPVTPADREAAFPDVGDMSLAEMMVADPFNRYLLFDRLEAQDGDDGEILNWDFQGWIGRNANRLVIRSEGGHEAGTTDHADLQLLWGRPVARWWDVVAGVRQDFRPGPSQGWAALGVQGLAPYRFELQATAYLGDGGRAAARLEAEYELLITNRLILQPVVELNWYSEDDAARGIGSGLSTAESGLRLRYEFRREIAPYIGLTRERTFGNTSDLARAAGIDTRETRLVAGVRLWF